MKTRYLLGRAVAGILVVVFCMMTLAGCASLRKKFTRVKKNKDQKEEFIPVLQPVEYEKVEETPQQAYANHYTMIRVYFKDLWDIFGKRGSNVKRERYMLTEILAHFDGMSVLLNEVKRQQALKLHARFLSILAIYEKPDGLRRYDMVIGDLRAVERDIYRLFKPAAVFDAFAPAVK